MKDSIRFLVFWVGTRCSLQCKNCGNLIPYIDPVSYDPDKILSNLAYVCDKVRIEEMQIQGGEPFTHKDIAKIVGACANMSNIDKIEISTNGTILPNEETIRVLAKHADKVTVRFSVYDCVKEELRQQKMDVLAERGVAVGNYNFMFSTGKWFDSGDYWQERKEDKEEVKTVYKSCNNRRCWTLADDYMASCGKILALRNLKKCGEGDNVLDITSLRLRAVDFLEALSEFDRKYIEEVPEMCAYCKMQNDRIPAAVQLSREEIERFKQDKQNRNI